MNLFNQDLDGTETADPQPESLPIESETVTEAEPTTAVPTGTQPRRTYSSPGGTDIAFRIDGTQSTSIQGFTISRRLKDDKIVTTGSILRTIFDEVDDDNLFAVGRSHRVEVTRLVGGRVLLDTWVTFVEENYGLTVDDLVFQKQIYFEGSHNESV